MQLPLPNSLIATTLSLLAQFERRRHIQLGVFALLMFLSVLAEILSIGAVIPFISVLTNPLSVVQYSVVSNLVPSVFIQNPENLMLPLTIIFISITVVATIIRSLVLWVRAKLTRVMGVELRTLIYSKVLYQPYSFHLSHNSSELISLVTEKASYAVTAGVLHVLVLINSVIVVIGIVVFLVVINPIIALSSAIVIGLSYLCIVFFVKKTIHKNGHIIAQSQPLAVKSLQEGVGGIRDVIMDSSHDVFIDAYTKTADRMQQAQSENGFLGEIPKPLLELIGISLIATLAYVSLASGDESSTVLPLLAAFALGAQRLLPALQQIYISWSTITGAQPLLQEIVDMLSALTVSNTHHEQEKPLAFAHAIELRDVDFSYANQEPLVLARVNLTINKGEKIGIIGQSGSGKSTLVDLIMGLTHPVRGQILVDGVPLTPATINRWRAAIAHVPQAIFLSDASVAENISFGVHHEKIDLERVRQAAQTAQIADFIEALPQGYSTLVGERGVRLSGGQRQRIGIARAIYKQASMIVLDEATSALDTDTEKAVIETLDALAGSVTIVMVAHRLSTLQQCDHIYSLSDNRLELTAGYESLQYSDASGKT